MSSYDAFLEGLKAERRRWLITGGAGFIGSHITEVLLEAGQEVVVLDNLSTGKRSNLDFAVAKGLADRLTVIEGDIRDAATCRRACEGVQHVHHHAAQVSVPRSVEDPAGNNADNVEGFVNILEAARAAGARRVVYASSSAVYGAAKTLPNHEDRPGASLSPYALSKFVDELYGDLYTRTYGLGCTGLRYFNVYGPRQDPKGAYAAVIAKWIDCLVDGQGCTVFGDGSATRDFVFVRDIVQANLRAALCDTAAGRVYNVATGRTVDLKTLYTTLLEVFSDLRGTDRGLQLQMAAPRAGDILHSSADITRIREELGFEARHTLAQGLRALVESLG